MLFGTHSQPGASPFSRQPVKLALHLVCGARPTKRKATLCMAIDPCTIPPITKILRWYAPRAPISSKTSSTVLISDVLAWLEIFSHPIRARISSEGDGSPLLLISSSFDSRRGSTATNLDQAADGFTATTNEIQGTRIGRLVLRVCV